MSGIVSYLLLLEAFLFALFWVLTQAYPPPLNFFFARAMFVLSLLCTAATFLPALLAEPPQEFPIVEVALNGDMRVIRQDTAGTVFFPLL